MTSLAGLQRWRQLWKHAKTDLESTDDWYRGLPESRPFRTRPLLRRAIYGMDHRYRTGDDPDRRRLMGIFLAAQYLTGAAVGLIALVGQNDKSHLWIMLGAVSAAVTGSTLIFVRKLIIPPWAYHALLVLGGIIISLGTYASGSLAPSVSIMFVAGTGYSYVFFFHWRAAIYLLAATVTYVLVLRALHISVPLQRGVILAVVSLVVGNSISTVVGREARFRREAEELREVDNQASSARMADWTYIAQMPMKLLASAHQELKDVRNLDQVRETLGLRILRYERLRAAYLSRQTRSQVSVPCIPAKIIRQCVELMRGFYPHLVADLELTSTDQQVAIDSEILREVLLELIDNAVQHGSTGIESNVTIAAELDQSTRMLRVVVYDRGQGVPKALNRSVQGLGWRGTSGGSDDGIYGTGLSLASWRLKTVGTELSIVEPEPNEGFGITFELPYTSSTTDSTALRVLVAEDFDTDKVKIVAAIERWRHSTSLIQVTSIRGARDEYTKRGLPDIAIIDLHLEDGDGLVIARELKGLRDPVRGRCLLVAYTNTPAGSIGADVFDHYIHKPLDRDKTKLLSDVVDEFKRR